MTIDRKKWALSAWRHLAEKPAEPDLEVLNTLVLRDELETMVLSPAERAELQRLDRNLFAHANDFVRAAESKQLLASIRWARSEQHLLGPWWWLDEPPESRPAAGK